VALLHCLACTAAYSVGAPACPHCGTGHQDEAVETPAPVEDEAPAPRKGAGKS